MATSRFSGALDDIQIELGPILKSRGFRKRGRTYNRVNDDGLTEVINFQMGPSNPPGTVYLPGVREDIHGLFIINLGIYVPEVGEACQIPAKKWVGESYCTLRSRLDRTPASENETWWPCDCSPVVLDEVRRAFDDRGFVFFDTYRDRAAILATIDEESPQYSSTYGAPRMVAGIMYAKLGEEDKAIRYLSLQRDTARSQRRSDHVQYIDDLAERLGLNFLTDV